MEKYEDIMNIILPTLREERKKTYCPFLPICPKTGKVLEIPMIEINKKKYDEIIIWSYDINYILYLLNSV